MDAHSPFSSDMVAVYTSLAGTLGIAIIIIRDILKEKQRQKELEMRRKWEVEDREYKERQARLADEAKAAATAAAKIASNASREIRADIGASRNERQAQFEEVKASVEVNTVLTQEAKDASKEALDVANGHNAKILKATEIANEAREIATTATTKLT